MPGLLTECPMNPGSRWQLTYYLTAWCRDWGKRVASPLTGRGNLSPIPYQMRLLVFQLRCLPLLGHLYLMGTGAVNYLRNNSGEPEPMRRERR